jgi:hypothetical protein
MKFADSELQKQLAEAQMEEQNAMAEFRRWGTPYYEKAWAESIDKVERLEAKIPKTKAHSA